MVWEKSEIPPISKITRAKRAGGMAQGLQHLSSKHQTLSSNPNNSQEKNKGKKYLAYKQLLRLPHKHSHTEMVTQSQGSHFTDEKTEACTARGKCILHGFSVTGGATGARWGGVGGGGGRERGTGSATTGAGMAPYTQRRGYAPFSEGNTGRGTTSGPGLPGTRTYKLQWPSPRGRGRGISDARVPAGDPASSQGVTRFPSPETSAKGSGTPGKELCALEKGEWPGEPRAPKDPVLDSPCALVVRSTESRCLVPSERHRGRGWSWQATGRAGDAEGRRSPAVAPSPWGLGTQPVAASPCHPPRHRRAPRRRLAPENLPLRVWAAIPGGDWPWWEDPEPREREGSSAEVASA
jgi:hypothetical protein